MTELQHIALTGTELVLAIAHLPCIDTRQFISDSALTVINLQESPIVSRVQLALNVSNLDEAIGFYSKLFAAEPAKVRPGYANFAIAEPPLKLVLIEGHDGGTLNHLGVEVDTGEEVRAAEARLSTDGLATTGVDDTTCCYALKTETWVADPDGAPWEFYVKNGDAEQMTNTVNGESDSAQCCDPAAMSESVAAGVGPASGCC